MNSPNRKSEKTLTNAQWRMVLRIVEKAQALAGSERESFLRQATASQPAIERQVRALLDGESHVDGFLEEPIGPRAARALVEASTTYAPGTSLGDFVIEKELGRGAFATVYLARQTSLDRLVALKASRLQDEEARMIARLEHEHIVGVYSEGPSPSSAAEGTRLICMQYVPSLDLQRLMDLLGEGERTERGARILEVVNRNCDSLPRLDPSGLRFRERLEKYDFVEAVAWVGIQLSRALDYAHSRDVLHLDIKPANILIDHYGKAFLTDFNISTTLEALKRGLPENFGGSVHYMSPEQRAVFRASDQSQAVRCIGPRSDIYSLGVVLKELLGRADRSEPARELERILDGATEPNPEDRFPSAERFGQALQGFLRLSRLAKRMPPWDALSRWMGNHPLMSFTVLAGIPQVVATVVGIHYNSMRIVSTLSPAQQQLFDALNTYYNSTVSGIVLVFWLSLVWRLTGYLNSQTREADRTNALRSHLLRLPRWGILVSTVAWVPGSLVFPATLHAAAGPLPAAAFGHFLISFLLSYLIALSYSYLLHEWTVLVNYSRFWRGAEHCMDSAPEELSGVPERLRLFSLMTGLIPLLGALLVVVAGPEPMSSDQYVAFRFLIGALIGAGVVGLVVALSVTHKLTGILYLWRGTRREDHWDSAEA